MNLNLIPPYVPLFLGILTTGTLITISAQNWVIIWVGLEINIIGFLPLLIIENTNNYTNSIGLYFTAQAIGSSILLASANESLPLTDLALLLNLGVAPFHLWVPQVFNSASWNTIALLSTWQNIGPLYILHCTTPLWNLSTLLGAISVFVGGVGAISHTNLKSYFAYSSITTTGWLVIIASSNEVVTANFLVYTFTLLPLIIIINAYNPLNLNQFHLYWNDNALIILLLISLAGIPPLPGFYANWIAIAYLTSTPALWISLVVILLSALIIYIYIIVTILVLLSNRSQTNNNCVTYTLPLLLITLAPIALIIL